MIIFDLICLLFVIDLADTLLLDLWLDFTVLIDMAYCIFKLISVLVNIFC